MPARKVTTEMNKRWREKIQTSMLINRLQDSALGKIELTQIQYQSINALLKKTVPDLSAVTISGDEDNPVKHDHNHKVTYVSPERLND